MKLFEQKNFAMKNSLFLCLMMFYASFDAWSSVAGITPVCIGKHENPTERTSQSDPAKEALENPADDDKDKLRSLVLSDRHRKTILLEDLVAKHKGKILYIDYWSSWCKPCRVALPASLKMRETLKDLPVVFVYFSIDSRRRHWRRASRQEKIRKYAENYLILDQDESAFLKKHKFNSIPRYMIFDQQGKLVDAMAAGPVNEDAESVLTKLAGATQALSDKL